MAKLCMQKEIYSSEKTDATRKFAIVSSLWGATIMRHKAARADLIVSALMIEVLHNARNFFGGAAVASSMTGCCFRDSIKRFFLTHTFRVSSSYSGLHKDNGNRIEKLTKKMRATRKSASPASNTIFAVGLHFDASWRNS